MVFTDNCLNILGLAICYLKNAIVHWCIPKGQIFDTWKLQRLFGERANFKGTICDNWQRTTPRPQWTRVEAEAEVDDNVWATTEKGLAGGGRETRGRINDTRQTSPALGLEFPGSPCHSIHSHPHSVPFLIPAASCLSLFHQPRHWWSEAMEH